ncbi:Uncharacterised protein [Mycobacteroides abscessus subsp. massiliense]|nr:Uncharacterised protein [Mycobacteroides abscessus subsp. massiliense]
MSSSDRTLFQIALVPAPEDGGQVLCQVQFENVGDAAGQKLTIVTHQHHTTAQIPDKVLQPCQSVEVEIVGRLIE